MKVKLATINIVLSSTLLSDQILECSKHVIYSYLHGTFIFFPLLYGINFILGVYYNYVYLSFL